MTALHLFSLLVCASLFVACPRAAADHEPVAAAATRRHTNWLKQLFVQDVNGGVTCATCTVLVGLVEQLTEIYNVSIALALEKYCNFLPHPFRVACKYLIVEFDQDLPDVFELTDTPDVVCHALGFCKNETGQFCHLFPLPQPGSDSDLHRRVLQARKIAQRTSSLPLGEARSRLYAHLSTICDIPIVKEICEIFERFGNDHLPIDDIDDDYFSDAQTFRGTSWRGRDCSDINKDIYPGRHTTDDAIVDTNCNGILGVDPGTGKTYESLWCNGTEQMGTVILGDSAGAHFHLPPSWFTSKDLNEEAFKDLLFILENEIDWPMMSSTTGYTNSTWPTSISGPVDSMYLRLRELNLCNHRDFQNIAVNGARASAMADHIVKGFARHGTKDNPVFLTLALIGNDVCSGHPNIDHMTKPDDFYRQNLETLRYVDSIVAPGSVVIGVGLVDGRVLYDSLHDHIHPIGSLNNDVTYAQFYDYLNCLQVSPCFGWMNSNETWRNQTTERAMQLNNAFRNMIKNETFKNLKAYYFDPPIKEAFKRWEKQGGKRWDLIEPVDGFHPNQQGNALTTQIMFEHFEEYERANNVKILPKRNPHNDKIRKMFGDQGGY